MFCGDVPGNKKGERAPKELDRVEMSVTIQAWESGNPNGAESLTAVTVSMQSTNGSEVKYRESESEYSFHNCPKRSCAPPMRVWLIEKYPATVKLLIRKGGTRWVVPNLRRIGGWCPLPNSQHQPPRGSTNRCTNRTRTTLWPLSRQRADSDYGVSLAMKWFQG